MQVPLPQTLGRLSQSCDIFATTGGNLDGANALNSFLSTTDLQSSSGIDPLSFLNSVTAMMNASQPLGSVERIELRQTREVERIHSLGGFAFEPYRVVPKAIRTSLTLHKVVLYKEDFLKSVGFNSYNLYYQQAPFIIRQTLVNPSDPSGAPDVLLFFDCWISSNPFVFDLSGGDNLVRQEVVVDCGRVFSSSAQYLYSTSKKHSRKNVPFY